MMAKIYLLHSIITKQLSLVQIIIHVTQFYRSNAGQTPMPNSFKYYNYQMGRVDLYDQFLANYRVRIDQRNDGPFFTWSLYDSAVNYWRLYRKLHGNFVPLLMFFLELMLKSWGKFINTVPEHLGNSWKIIKLDTINHVLVKGASKYRRCKQCGRRTCANVKYAMPVCTQNV